MRNPFSDFCFLKITKDMIGFFKFPFVQMHCTTAKMDFGSKEFKGRTWVTTVRWAGHAEALGAFLSFPHSSLK